jgi:hypothetical protein
MVDATPAGIFQAPAGGVSAIAAVPNRWFIRPAQQYGGAGRTLHRSPQ